MALAPQEVGARIAKRRKELGWTHQRLADEMNVELRTVQRWQKGVSAEGKSTLPRLATLMELADKMDVARSYFIESDEDLASEKELADRLEELEAQVVRGFEALEAAIEQLASQLPRQGAR
jgi:transcriptional regulator with XRE-family HTH domain